MRIEMTSDVDGRIRKLLRAAGYRETGGMLFAEQLAPDRFCIIDISVDAVTGSSTRFVRNLELHRRALDDFFRRTGCEYRRFNYLGEWHSHPSYPVRPSDTDIRTMTEIVESRSSVISFAVLLIARLRWRFWVEHSLTIFARNQPPLESRIRSHIVRI